jgi:hypothetical protein
MSEHGFPRQKDQLLREIDLRMRLGDIRKVYETKSRLAPKWWEGVILLVLFSSALGLLASLVQYARSTGTVIDNWIIFWFGLMVLTVVFSFEFLLVKIYALRRANELVVKILEEMRGRQDTIDSRIEEMLKARPTFEPPLPAESRSGEPPGVAPDASAEKGRADASPETGD